MDIALAKKTVLVPTALGVFVGFGLNIAALYAYLATFILPIALFTVLPGALVAGLIAIFTKNSRLQQNGLSGALFLIGVTAGVNFAAYIWPGIA